ncbi:MAG: hypothetical protein DRP06_01510 [Candidatus Aenigmatarchaeota archaeon]|nr:MAG: hypothetical protein DRP06_01510 [Candidatus Aenigmarchaeota archaeon]
MKKKRFVLRDEPFGYTLFDRVKMKHKFLAEADLDKELYFSDVIVKDFEKWSAELSDAPNEIIYSPIRIYFELTSGCNLRCKTCFNQSGKIKPNELDTEEVKNVLEGMRNDNILDMRFSGGEVTTRDDWFELLKYAKDLGFAVSLNTNGVYSDPETTIDKLASLDLEQITLSIDGNKEFHDYLRGNGNYDKTIKSLEQLYEKDAHLRINTILTKGSDASLEDILSLAGKFVEEINFFYMRPTGRALEVLDQASSYEELYAFDKRIEGFKPNYPQVNILHGSKVMQNNSVDSTLSSNVNLQMGGPDGFTRFNLLSDGAIWPGGYTPYLRPDFYLGNIKEENYTVLDVWRNSPELRKFRKISSELQKKCLNCSEKNVRCPGASMEMEFYREKTLNNKNPYCIK